MVKKILLVTALMLLAVPETGLAAPPAGSFGQSLKDFLSPASQPSLGLTLFGGGLASEDLEVTDEAIQANQSLTRGLSLVGRVTGFQLWVEKNATSPLQPSNRPVGRLNFVRFESGLGFDLSPTTNFTLLGGHDAGDSDAWVIESNFTSWFNTSGKYPFSLLISPVHDFQNDVTSSEIDVRFLTAQTADYELFVGAGGSVYGGGFISAVAGQGGPNFGIYSPRWQVGADLQTGYGTLGGYGLLTIYKTLAFAE